jgi:peptide/nickel transport system substrate-binding protein
LPSAEGRLVGFGWTVRKGCGTRLGDCERREGIVTDGEHDDPRRSEEEDDEGALSRAAFLKGASGVLALGLPLGGGPLDRLGTSLLADTPLAGKPRRGGQLRVGYVGGGTAETINPSLGVTPIDEGRIQSIFDPLVLLNADLSMSPGLALEWLPNKTATVYEVKLRPGVTFHNGKTFDAEDVIYSIRLMAKKTSIALPFVSGIRLGDLKAVNKTTLRIPLKFPDANLAANFVYYNTWIVQKGEKNFSHPVGTGPFEFRSFTPGRQSIFARNPNYWGHGGPYVDTLKIVSISDPTARLNALLSGQIDAMAQMSYAQAKAHQATRDIQVLVAHAPQVLMFYMDTTRPPFNDNRVRLAMKLIPDRPTLIRNAISGFGTVGNDIVGKGLQFYDNSLPQHRQDIPHAKSLLKAAGREGLKVVLQTSDVIPGFVESATLLAQQAAKAGVTIKLQQVPASSYFNPSLKYLKMLFAETQWPPSSLKFFYLQALASNAPFNETHWHSKSFNRLLFKAIGELNHAKAQSYWNDVQEIQWRQGGYLNWTNADFVDGLSKKVKGIKPSAAGILGNHRFQDAWLS